MTRKNYSQEQYAAIQKEKMDEILKSLEEGVRNVFSSENYIKYLETFSRFHNYSINNIILILMAYPAASHVASYMDWKKKFNRSVKKGEHGIRILVPTPKKITAEREVTNPDGSVTTEEVEYKRMYFKQGTVFDVSQTEGEDLPSLVKNLTWNDEALAASVNAIMQNSPVSISFDDELTDGSANGYYSLTSGEIKVKPTLSNLHMLKTICHELSHAYQETAYADSVKELDRSSKEVISESCAFCVLRLLSQEYCIPQIKSDEYSFGYVAGWGSRDLKELKATLNLIRDITEIIFNQVSPAFSTAA